jgi:outer membrane protein TolC
MDNSTDPPPTARLVVLLSATLLAGLFGLPSGAEAQSQSEPPLLSYEEAVSLAVEQNHDVEIARRQTEIAERDVSVGNAGFLPSIEAVARQNRQFGGPGFFGQGQVFSQTTLGVQLDWLVFGGLGRWSTLDRLEAERTVSQLQTAVAVEETLVEVATAYWNVVRQRQLLEALEETRQVSRERVEIARARLEAQVGTKVDVNLARVELNRDKSAVADQRIALLESKTRLNQTLGRPADTSFRVDEPIEVRRQLDYAGMRDRALEANRRLRVARKEIDVAAEAVDEVEAERWPTLNLNLGYNYTGFHSGVAPNFDEAARFEYGLSLAVPLFRGLNVRRRIRNARTRRTIQSTEVRRQKTRIRAEVRNAWEAYSRHIERIALADESVDLADENVSVALTELEAGAITQVELRQIQLNLLDARTRLINAKFAAKEAEVRLRRLAGRLYDQLVGAS